MAGRILIILLISRRSLKLLRNSTERCVYKDVSIEKLFTLDKAIVERNQSRVKNKFVSQNRCFFQIKYSRCYTVPSANTVEIIS